MNAVRPAKIGGQHTENVKSLSTMVTAVVTWSSYRQAGSGRGFGLLCEGGEEEIILHSVTREQHGGLIAEQDAQVAKAD